MTTTDMFDPYPYAEPQLRELRKNAVEWREAQELANDKRAAMNRSVLKCRAADISYERIREATGLGISQIQEIVRKAHKG